MEHYSAAQFFNSVLQKIPITYRSENCFVFIEFKKDINQSS